MSYSRRELYALGEPLGESVTAKKFGGGYVCGGGGGSGGGTTQSTQTGTTYQTNIPEYLEDPTKRMVSRGETLSEQPYIPYTGARVAGLTPEQKAVYGEIGGMETPGQFGQAGETLTGAERFGAAGALGAMGYAPGTFDKTAAEAYMSPYQQAVTDVAKREATSEAALMNRQLAGQAAKAGAFGGSRFGVEQALLGSKLAQNLSDIQTKGSQEAYLNAQQQYERDRAAQLAGANLNLQGAQFGAQTGLQAAQQRQGLGTAQQTADLQRLAAQESAGKAQQEQQQAELNTAYNQFLEQRDWEKNQLGFLSGIIRGTPFSTSQTGTTTAPAPSTTSQLAGLGIAGIGLANLLK